MNGYQNKFSTSARNMRSSAIREMLKHTEVPGMISLAGGIPSPDSFPITEFSKAMTTVMTRNGSEALQYGRTEGYTPLRELLAERMNKIHNLQLTADNIMITSGSQQALYYLAKIFLDPGDNIICEDPSFVGALLAFRSFQANILPLPVGRHGANAETLESMLQENIDRMPKFTYLMTAIHNPTGISATEEYRRKVASLSERYGILLIDDDPYSEIAFSNERPRCMADCMPLENLVYLGSFSKTVAPGLRLGWMAAPEEIIMKASQAKQAEDLCTSSLAQFCLYELLTGSDHADHVATVRERYCHKRNLMLDLLHKKMPQGTRIYTPAGGIFCWVELPEHINTTQLLPKALEAGVAFVPGASFFCSDSGQNTMRLNFSYPSETEIEIAINRLEQLFARN